MFLETVSSVLKHSDISTITTSIAETGNNGSWKLGKQSTTWRVNMRNLLGSEMYDNNDMFVLRLNQLSYAADNFPLTTRDQQVIITLSGLNFSNSTYDVKTGNSSNIQQLVLLNMSTNAYVESYPPNIAMCNFKKSQENIEFTIELIRTIDNLPAQYNPAAAKFPHMVYQFDIYPVPK
jgi:hypothetical protein